MAPRRSRGRARSDDDLVRLEAAFARCEQRLGRYLVQMVADRALAEDLLQDTFHDALRARSRLGTVESVEAWLFGIARNRALRALRSSRRFRRAFDRLTQQTRPAVSDDPDVLSLLDLLERHLSAEDRALVLLFYLHGFGASELAAMTGRSYASVRKRLSRARLALLTAVRDGGLRPEDAERRG